MRLWLLSFLALASVAGVWCQDLDQLIRYTTPRDEMLPCIAFSPYVEGFNPNFGPHPPVELLGTLLDRLVDTGRVECILVYGLNGPLAEIPRLAEERGLKVFVSIWLDEFPDVNDDSIAQAISVIDDHRDTVIAISCGSEVWLRNDIEIAEREIGKCIDRVREAGLPQPITHIATWIEWCKFTYPLCPPWDLADRLDFVSTTVYAWWENRQGRFGCNGPEDAGWYHINRVRDNQRAYPDKLIVMAEFGWPRAPEGYVDSQAVGPCNVAGRDEQHRAMTDTLALLKQMDRQGILFSSHEEPWKGEVEGPFAAHWGVCSSAPPYECDIPPIGDSPPPEPEDGGDGDGDGEDGAGDGEDGTEDGTGVDGEDGVDDSAADGTTDGPGDVPNDPPAASSASSLSVPFAQITNACYWWPK